MYIICETLGADDFRFVPGMKQLYQHWIFAVYEIPENIKININHYNGQIINEDTARAMKFAMTDKGKIGIRTGTNIHEDLFAESGETTEEKQYYYLTEEDDRNTVDLMKVEMHLYLGLHYASLSLKEQGKYAGKKQEVVNMINSCETITDCQRLQHTHFGVENVSHAKKDWNLGSATFDLSEKNQELVFNN